MIFQIFPNLFYQKKKKQNLWKTILWVLVMLKPLLHSKAKSKKKVESTLEKHYFPYFSQFSVRKITKFVENGHQHAKNLFCT